MLRGLAQPMLQSGAAQYVNTWGEASSDRPTTPDVAASDNRAIVGNKRTKIYHRPDCSGAAKVSQQNRVLFTTEAEAQKGGYHVARNCP